MWKRKWRVAVSAYGILLWVLTVVALLVLDLNPHYFSTYEDTNGALIVYDAFLYYLLLLFLVLQILVPISYGFLVHLLAIKCSERFERKNRLLISFFVHLFFCFVASFFIIFLIYFYSFVEPDPFSVFFPPSFDPYSDPYSVVFSYAFDPSSAPFHFIYSVAVSLIGMFVVGETFRYLEQRNNRRMIELLTWGPVLSWVVFTVVMFIFLILFVGVPIIGYW